MADYEVGWARAPRISLEFEFQTAAVSAFFTLILDQTNSVVDLKRVWFASKQESDAAATCLPCGGARVRSLARRGRRGACRMRAEPPDRGPVWDVQGRRVRAGDAARSDFTYFVVEIPASDRPPTNHPPMNERRSGRRMRTRLHQGLIAERTGGPVIDCLIRDQTSHGARLQLDKHRPLPRTFLLTDTATRKQVRVALVWQVGRNAGVRITKG